MGTNVWEEPSASWVVHTKQHGITSQITLTLRSPHQRSVLFQPQKSPWMLTLRFTRENIKLGWTGTGWQRPCGTDTWKFKTDEKYSVEAKTPLYRLTRNKYIINSIIRMLFVLPLESFTRLMSQLLHFLYEEYKNVSRGEHARPPARPSVRNPVLASKPSVGFSWNSVWKFLTRFS
jgi:hypothetical protein